MSSHILCERDVAPHVGRIIIRRADQANAFTLAMVDDFRVALTDLESDDAIKVIVIAAEGEHLTRGFDPAEVEKMYTSAPGGGNSRPSPPEARLSRYSQMTGES